MLLSASAFETGSSLLLVDGALYTNHSCQGPKMPFLGGKYTLISSFVLANKHWQSNKLQYII